MEGIVRKDAKWTTDNTDSSTRSSEALAPDDDSSKENEDTDGMLV